MRLYTFRKSQNVRIKPIRSDHFWRRHGAINGIRFLNDNMASLKIKEIVVFATGATPPIKEEIKRFRQANLPCDQNIKLFYFQSGMNYADMRCSDKLLMGLLKAFLKLKKSKTNTEQGAADAIQNSYDYSNRSQIEPLIQYVNSMQY